ncbi:hypothetical protein QAD02_017937 [Eretmocerus hayati]|uniref:Uncharacterized protein n=1 Tax=Eretmocerus hayati TaxID=131215 RepID=A0ACC2PFD0_9HYME|nr:hypothetical protein QAD02_017937 [Eretmocerus hayati]
MMSDSDDTDVLLLIPPDLFNVPSSDSDDSSDSSSCTASKSGVVSQLIDHVQSLESRISAIELKDSFDNTLDHSQVLSSDLNMNSRQTLPRTRFSVSQNSSSQSTPNKFSQCLSLPPTPSLIQHQHHTNKSHPSAKSYVNDQHSSSNTHVWNEHDNSVSHPGSVLSQPVPQNGNPLHVGNGSGKESYSGQSYALNTHGESVDSNSHKSPPALNSLPNILADHPNLELKPIKDMSLSEVEEFLREIEARDRMHIVSNGNYEQAADARNSFNKQVIPHSKENQNQKKVMEQQKSKFSINGYSSSQDTPYQSDRGKKKDVADSVMHNDSSFSSFDTEKIMDDFKTWTPSIQLEMSNSHISLTDQINFDDNEKNSMVVPKSSDQRFTKSEMKNLIPSHSEAAINDKRDNVQSYLDSTSLSKFVNGLTKSQTILSSSSVNQDPLIESCKSCPSIFKAPSAISNPVDYSVKKFETSKSIVSNSAEQNCSNSVNSTPKRNQRPQRLLTLSDFWNNDSSRTVEDQLKIKLEEERFRREHCEQLIQDLQKKLLEQQEKVAVAIRVDNEKNSLLVKLQVSWKRMKQRLCELESEQDNLQRVLKSVTDKHQLEINEYQEQIKTCKEEISKALNLATGYKEKSDSLTQEKADLLKSHAEELQNCRSCIQEADIKYEEMKLRHQELQEKIQQKDEVLKTVQQDLNRELMKSGEVRAEMAVVHKALDTCETELTILRQERENLQLKLKEEMSRNNILEQSKASLVDALDEANKAEKQAKNDLRMMTEQQEKLRAELREVYQKQVDDVVQKKLQEFQNQLDSAETVYQNELEAKQRAIAECAARKIKSVIDKHQLEINLVEEKHREEKRLFGIKLDQALQKSSLLEAQLSTYRKSKNQIAEQLHCMMQKQWQQALLIISGGNVENLPSLQKLGVDKLFEVPNELNLDMVPNHCSTLHAEPTKLEMQKCGSPRNTQTRQIQNESLVTLTSSNDTPLTSRKESKDDLRKYIKMILDMQQSKENYSRHKFLNGSPPSSIKDNSNQQKDGSTSNDANSSWQPISEISMHDTSEYLSVPQKFNFKGDKSQKPPWK